MKTINVSNTVYKRLESFRLLAQLENKTKLNYSQVIDIAINETGWIGRYSVSL